MHNELRELLREASGESQFVLAVNIDIRGFSSFFADSSQAAAFLSFAYTSILDDYFAEHSFFKPTGDGLLLVREIDRDTIGEAVRESIEAALRLDADFASLCADDALINYPTPEHVGIGLARGTATRLSAKGKTLDYSGRPLNLASRLMDLARPRGVVFDASLLAGLDASQLGKGMNLASVYIKGIADSQAMSTFNTPGVRIPQTNRRPFGSQNYVQRESAIKRSTAAQRHRYTHALAKEPFDLDDVKLQVAFPATDSRGNKHPNMLRNIEFRATDVFEESPGKWSAIVDYNAINKVLTGQKVKTTWDVGLQLRYRIAADAGPLDGADILGPGEIDGDGERSGTAED